MLDINLKDVLKVNNEVKTQTAFDTTWTDNIILDIKKDLITMVFKDEYLKLLLTVGDTLKIRFMKNKKEYFLIGLVENVIFGNPYKLILKVESNFCHTNDRKHPRFIINYFCKIEPENEDFKIQGITTDISEGGISLVTYIDFNVTSSVNVEIFTFENVSIYFKGNIKRLEAKINNHIQYGVEITEINNKNKQLLKKLLEK